MPDQIVTITADGKPRLLFKITQRSKSDDVTIVLRHLSRLGKPSEYQGHAPTFHAVKEMHASIHCSLDSKTDINAIKLTTIFDNGPESIRNYTQALKQHDHYAHVFGCYCPTLKHDRFLLNEQSDEAISLGRYDPAYFTLIYQVLVSNVDAPTPISIPGLNEFMNIKCLEFSRFRVWVLWNFLNVPSSDYGRVVSIQTMEPENLSSLTADVADAYRALARGLSADQIQGQFVSFGKLLWQQYISLLETGTPQAASLRNRKTAGYKHGTEESLILPKPPEPSS